MRKTRPAPKAVHPNRKPIKALVLGATGHIGNAVVRELLERGYQVTAASRRQKPAANLAGLAVNYAPGDADNPGQLELWIAGHDVVVDAAAPYPMRLFESGAARDSAAYAAQRTRALLNAARAHQARLVYVSSFTTISRPDPGLDGLLSRMVRAAHPYFALKDLIESEVMAAAREGLPAVIVNPTMCLGPWELKTRELCFIPRLLAGEIPTGIRHIVNVIDVRDVAAGLAAALEARRYGQPILLSGHNVSTEELFSWICEIGGARPPRLFAPASLGVLTGYWTEMLLTMLGQESPLPALAAMLTYTHEWQTPGAAQRELGIVPRPLSATLLDAIRWYRTIGYC